MVRRLQEDADPNTVEDDGALVNQRDDGSIRASLRRRYAERGRAVWRVPSAVVDEELRAAAFGAQRMTDGVARGDSRVRLVRLAV